jgi:hypothetical protein
MLLEDLPHVTLKLAKTNAVTVKLIHQNNVITEEVSELNQTTEINPTNVERDVFSQDVETESLMTEKSVTLELPMELPPFHAIFNVDGHFVEMHTSTT